MRTTLESLTPNDRRVLALLERALDGHMAAQQQLKYEALSTSDFTSAFQKVTNYTLDQAYTEAPAPLWPKLSQRHVNDTLRPEKFKSLDWNLGMLPEDGGGIKRYPTTLPHVPELTPYPIIGFSAGERDLTLGKFGARTHFSWEAWKHDDWGMIERMPAEIALAAVRTEDFELFTKIFDTNGWNATYLSTRHLAGDTQLTLQSLEAALEQASAITEPSEANGYRINTVSKWNLVVPVGMAVRARAILAATEIKITDADGTQYLTANTVAGKIADVVEVPYIPLISTGAAFRSTMWGLFPAAGQGSDRPTFVNIFLRGYEQPQFRVKNDAGQGLDAYEGSFDYDDIQTRTRHFAGAAVIDTTGIVVSNGTGTP